MPLLHFIECLQGAKRSEKRGECLVQGLAEADVDDIQHRGAGGQGGGGDGHETEHGKAAVDELRLGGQAGLEGRDEAGGGLGGVALLLHQGVLRKCADSQTLSRAETSLEYHASASALV